MEKLTANQAWAEIAKLLPKETTAEEVIYWQRKNDGLIKGGK